ncbi:MAG: hypothetical protein WDZ28_05770 [Simkaniaceae bacterium]
MIKLKILSVVLMTIFPSQKPERVNEEARVINEVQKELHVQCVCIGGSLYKGKEHLSYKFNYYKKLGIDGAREVAVDLVDKLREKFNESPIHSEYLKVDKIEDKHLYLALFLNNEDGSDIDKAELNIISIRYGNIYYNNMTDVTKCTMHKESIEEARQILLNQKSDSNS